MPSGEAGVSSIAGNPYADLQAQRFKPLAGLGTQGVGAVGVLVNLNNHGSRSGDTLRILKQRLFHDE